MNICFVSPFAYGLYNESSGVRHGGAELDLYYIAQELARRPDFSVTVVTGDFGQPATERYGAITVHRSFRTNLRGLGGLAYRLAVAGPKLFLALRRTRADIYVQEGAGFETALVAIFAKLAGKKFVYRVASTVECTNEVVTLWPRMGRWFLWGMRQANAIVTEDQEEVELLQQYHRLPATAIYDTTPIPDLTKIVPTVHRRHILWVGRLVPMKRVEIFIDLAKEFPSEQFIMIASVDPANQGYNKKIQDQVASLPNVTHLPGRKHHQLDPYYAEAKLFINTSDFEGYPNTFIEAGKYAVPVISYRVNPDRLFTDERFGAWAQGDLARFKQLISNWLADEKKRDRAGKNFSNYVRSKNDIRINIADYLTLFNQVAG